MSVEVGHRFPDTTFRVEPLRVEEYLTALGVDAGPGVGTEIGDTMPIGFLMYVTTFGADPVHEALEVDYLHAVYGGASYEVHQSVRVGDTLTLQTSFTGEQVKSGGALRLLEITCDYLLQDGTLAVRERSTTIERGQA